MPNQRSEADFRQLREFILDVFHRSNLRLDDQNSIGALFTVGIPMTREPFYGSSDLNHYKNNVALFEIIVCAKAHYVIFRMHCRQRTAMPLRLSEHLICVRCFANPIYSRGYHAEIRIKACIVRLRHA